MRLFKKKSPIFYAPCCEIPTPKREKYRYLDVATQKMIKIASNRMVLAAGIFLLCLSVVLVRLFCLTVLNHSTNPLKPTQWNIDESLPRYNIVDRNGASLATSYTTYDIYVRHADIESEQQVTNVL